MYKIIAFFVFILSFQAIGSTYSKNLFANIYADSLIREFDRILSLSTSTENNQLRFVYAQILAARDYIEHSGKVLKMGEKSILSITNVVTYNEVIQDIDESAKKIFFHISNISHKEKKLGVIYPSLGPTGNLTGNTYPNNTWSLTFDDGPHHSRTKEVVDNLYEHNLKASFFMLMTNVDKYPDALQYVLDSDMELALHSYNHLNLVKESHDVIDFEIKTAKAKLIEKSKKEISLFRLPYGSGTRDEYLRKTIADESMVHVFWNVDTLDWKDKDPASIFKRTILQMELTPHKSGIILFHDIHAQTVIASKLVMDYLVENKKTVCIVSEVVKLLNAEESLCSLK